MTTIQVFGYTGMLGQAVCRAVLKAGHRLDMITRETYLDDYNAGYPLVNCAGLVKQSRDYFDNVSFLETNTKLPHILSIGYHRVIHVSTDCVFNHPGPHDENDYISGTDIYARSKFAGEITDAPHLTIRTSFVGYGRHGLIRDMQTKEQVKASNNLLWTGHTADTIAEILVHLATREDVTGLLHIPGEFTTRLALCYLLKHNLNLPAEIVQDDSFVADRRLISNRWDRLGMPELPPLYKQIQGLM